MQFIQNTKSKFEDIVFLEHFTCFPKCRNYFGVDGLFCIINVYFEYRIRILCIGLYIGTWFKCIFEHFSENKINTSKTNPRSVNKFRTDQFVRDVLGFWVAKLLYCYSRPEKEGRREGGSP